VAAIQKTFTQAGDLIANLGGGANNPGQSIVVQVTGGGTLTLRLEGSLDGTNFVGLMGKNLATGADTPANGDMTAAGLYRFDVSAIDYVQLRCSAFTSGTLVGLVEYGDVATRA